MLVRVYMLAFGREGEVREVGVPDSDWAQAAQDGPEDHEATNRLNLVYHYGQNEVQARQHPSLSVGDVIEIGPRLFIVRPAGFSEVTSKEFERYKRLPRRERSWSPLARPEA